MLYEMVQHIPNMCPGNQMRDVFFTEVETDDPVAYVKGILQDKNPQITFENLSGGVVRVFAQSEGFIREFSFTPAD